MDLIDSQVDELIEMAMEDSKTCGSLDLLAAKHDMRTLKNMKSWEKDPSYGQKKFRLKREAELADYKMPFALLFLG